MKKIGNRRDVFIGSAYKTTGGLKKEDLIKNNRGKIVSKKLSIIALNKYLQIGGDVIEPTSDENGFYIYLDNEMNNTKFTFKGNKSNTHFKRPCFFPAGKRSIFYNGDRYHFDNALNISSEVYLYKNENNKELVLKRRKVENNKRVINQIKASNNKNNILKYIIPHKLIKSSGKNFLIMEYAPDLFHQKLEGIFDILNETMKLKIMYIIIYEIYMLSTYQYYYTDIKLKNFFSNIKDKKLYIYLGDLGSIYTNDDIIKNEKPISTYPHPLLSKSGYINTKFLNYIIKNIIWSLGLMILQFVYDYDLETEHLSYSHEGVYIYEKANPLQIPLNIRKYINTHHKMNYKIKILLISMLCDNYNNNNTLNITLKEICEKLLDIHNKDT